MAEMFRPSPLQQSMGMSPYFTTSRGERIESSPYGEGVIGYSVYPPLAKSPPRGTSGLLQADVPVDGGTIGGLIGDDLMQPRDFGSRLTDARRAGGLAKLSGMLMGLATPTRRGESRLMNSMMLGQKMGQQAEAEETGRINTEIAVDKYQRERAKSGALTAAMKSAFGDGATSMRLEDIALPEQFARLPEDKQRDIKKSIVFERLGDAVSAFDPEQAETFYDRSKTFYDKAFEGELTPAEYRKESVALGRTFADKEVDDRLKIVQSARRLTNLGDSGNPMDDIAMIFEFMKTLDPASIVRDSEVGMVRAAGGLHQRLISMLGDASGRGALSGPLRKAIQQTAIELAQIVERDYQNAVANQQAYAREARLDPTLAIGSRSTLGVEDLLDFRKGIELTDTDKTALSDYYGDGN